MRKSGPTFRPGSLHFKAVDLDYQPSQAVDEGLSEVVQLQSQVLGAIAVLLDVCVTDSEGEEEVYSRHIVQICSAGRSVHHQAPSGARCERSRTSALLHSLEQPPHADRE